MACTIDYHFVSQLENSARECVLQEPSPAPGNHKHSGINDALPARLHGFVLFLPELDRVFWSERAASLHGEQLSAQTEFNLRQFMQWYLPNQRDLFAQSLFVEAQGSGFQIDLCIAHNKQHVRYLCIPLKYRNTFIWAGFVRSARANNSSVLVDFAVQKTHQLLAELI
ncbi:hypothetical protein A28LD_2111 [Idiomarina sp. A28L]|uniref:hypothetical protein n=1 Tax=Idiomarina sp. A28L TaxID=1036674 RepID=UPI0002138B5D|nr:hypothetical protein [Idiomarina sp. A28L]EGN74325.1 hypothetical protein A28LD_2111 [Idiomarina sp. A28L]